MNVRVILIIPAALVVAALTGCGGGGSDAAKDGSPAQLRMPSTEVCHAPAYIRERAPEGVCTDTAD